MPPVLNLNHPPTPKPLCVISRSVSLSRKNIHFESWLAIFGLHAQSGGASLDVQTRRVDRVIMHPHYNRQTKQADIALMHLQQPINFTGQYQTEYNTLITNTSGQLYKKKKAYVWGVVVNKTFNFEFTVDCG